MVRAGALGFKAFMIDSGVDSFGRVDADDLRAALPVIRDLNVPLLLQIIFWYTIIYTSYSLYWSETFLSFDGLWPTGSLLPFSIFFY